MLNQILIGLGAGAASALLYFAVATGTPLAFALFYVAPLPVFVAGLGWGTATGAVAAVTGGIVTALTATGLFGLAFFLAFSAPAAWLARLATMNRPIDPDDAAAGIEWYPAGRIMLWTAGIGAAVAFAGITFVGGGVENFRAALATVIDRMFQEGVATQFGLPEDADRQAMTNMLATVLPPLSAAIWTLTMGVNLWLAARITIASGRLGRPMPAISRIDYPPLAAAAFGAGLAMSFLPGAIGLAGALVAAALLIAYVVLGLAVVHAITRGMNGRPLILGALYATMVVLAWTLPFLAALGLAETFLHFRDRAAANNPPPRDNS